MLNSIVRRIGKIATVFIAGLVIFFALSFVSIPRLNFSGKWVINYSKSEFGKAPLYTAPKQINIKQNVDSIEFARLNLRNDLTEEYTTNETVSMNGLNSTSLLYNRRTKTSTMKWTEDSMSLKEVSTYSLPDNPSKIDYKINSAFSLSEGGKILTVVIMAELQARSYSVKVVYEKAN